MNIDISNKKFIDIITEELRSCLNANQIKSVIVIIALFSAVPIMLEPKINLANIIIVLSVFIYLVMYFVTRLFIEKQIRTYFISMGMSGIIVPLNLLISSYRYLMLYKQDSIVYIALLMLVSVLGFLFHYKWFMRKMRGCKKAKSDLVIPVLFAGGAGASGLIFAKTFLKNLSQEGAMLILAVCSIIALLIYFMNMKYLIICYLMKQRNINFDQLKLGLKENILR